MATVTLLDDDVREVRQALESVLNFLTSGIDERCKRCYGTGRESVDLPCPRGCIDHNDHGTREAPCKRCSATGWIKTPLLGKKGMIQGMCEFLPQCVQNALDRLP